MIKRNISAYTLIRGFKDMNKKMRFSMMVVAGILMAGNVYAADAKIGFINVNQLASKSTAAAGLQMQYEKTMKSFIEWVQQVQAVLAEKEKAIADSEKKLSRAELGKKVDEYASEKEAYQRQVSKLELQIKENYNTAMQKFLDEGLTPVTEKLAKERKFDAVLNQSVALYISKEANLTEDAIEMVNEKMPKIDMPKIDAAKSTSSKKKKK